MTVNGENLISIKTKVAEIMAESNKHELELQKVQNMADAKIYDMSHILKLRDEENARYKVIDYNLRNELRGRVDALFDALHNSKADINSPAFSNALNLITTLGKEMDAKTLGDIVSNFRGNMGELNLLKKACKSAGIGNCIAVFDDYTFDAGHQEAWKRQVDNLLVFSHSFGITAEILGEDMRIDGESVVKDASRSFGTNKVVL